MKVTLRESPQYDSALRQVLHNRGIEDISNYLNAGMEDISPPEALGEEVLKQGAKCLISHISAQDKILVVVDADCDGYTSSAILINYLHDLFPSFVEENLEWYIHESKQHGLSDCIDVAREYDMAILPDASSNDYTFHKELKENNIDILILDHHEAEHISEDAIVINNQLSNYSNKELSGAGVTWQFCRYLDKINQTNYAQDYLDLVALGLSKIERIYLFH